MVRVACLALVVAALCGCQSYRPVAVEVRDAETKRPIPGAEVRISYPVKNTTFPPMESAGLTAGDGIARLQATPYGDAGTAFEVSAKGYMAEHRYLTAKEVEAFAPAGWFEDVTRRSPGMVLEMYAEPRPTVELIAPIGFRGMIKIKVQTQEGAPLKPGQRLFTYEIPPSGEVLATGHPMLRRVTPLDYKARYPDGTPLERTDNILTVGLRWLKCDGNTQYFVIGNLRDFNEARQWLQREAAGQNQAADGKAGGRHGKRGGDPSAVSAIP